MTQTQTQIKVRRGENIDKVLKKFKRIIDKEGTLVLLRERKFYVKPGDKKRKKSARARARVARIERLKALGPRY